MPPLRLVVLAVTAALVATTAFAQEKRSFESLWSEATRGQHKVTDYGDYTMIDAGDVFWYFTKAGHDAHPGVVRRALEQRGEQVFIDTQGWSFASEPGQPGFKRWLAEFDVLNKRVMQALEQRRQGR
jgi:hypothetical protein